MKEEPVKYEEVHELLYQALETEMGGVQVYQTTHAVRAKGAEAAVRPYAPDAVNFESRPPLAHRGAEATNPEGQERHRLSAGV